MADLGITGNIIASILYDAATGTYREFNEPFSLALKDTSIHFLQEEDIEFRIGKLKRILEGDVGTGEIEKFKAGRGLINANKLALQFAIFGDLYFQDESEILPLAKQILDYFIQRFEHYLLQNPQTGLAIIKSYVVAHSTQIHSLLEALVERIESLETQTGESIRKIIEELVTLPISEYISYDNRLQKLAKERGVSTQQLKDEIDDWITQVKEPYEKGLAALYRKKYQEAENYLHQSIKASKQLLAVKFYFLGNAQIGNKVYDQAIISYQTVIDIEPSTFLTAYAYVGLGIGYAKQEKFNEATASYKKSIDLNPTDDQAHTSFSVSDTTGGDQIGVNLYAKPN